MKKCRICENLLPLSDYNINDNNVIVDTCKTCINKFKKKKYRDRNSPKPEIKKREKLTPEQIKQNHISSQIKYDKKRRSIDDIYKFRQDIRSLLKQCYYGKLKRENSNWFVIMLGISCDEFKDYLINTAIFRYGYYNPSLIEYEIDHIIPISTAKTKEDVIKLNHWTNLQLLTKCDNRTKV